MQSPRGRSMAHKVSYLFGALAAVAVVIAGCERDRGPTQPLTKSLSLSKTPGLVSGSRHPRPAEQGMVKLANEIHGFAGYYIERGSGQLVAYVKDTATAFGTAARALNSHLMTDGFGLPQRARPKNVRIVRADYDFQTLSDYRDLVSDSIMMVVPGVAWVDLDEAINRVSVGILPSTAAQTRAAILVRTKQMGIPTAAINFVVDAYARLSVAHVSTVAGAKGAKRGKVATGAVRRLSANNLEAIDYDTIAAGVNFEDLAGLQSLCTVGAVVDSGSQRLFVSDSHCTQDLYQNDGDIVKSINATPWAYEQNDPAPARTCAFLGFPCWYHRSSDAASFKLYSIPAANTRVGLIARPSTRQYVGLGGSRDTSISATNPWLYITGTLSGSSIVVGMEIDKIGSRGGWTYGTVSSTCVDIYVLPSSQVYCTVLSHDMANREGDSGGPVFVWDGLDGATLIGTVEAGWGSSASYWGGTEYVGTYFNYWQSVLFDLGNLNATDNTSVGAPFLTGSTNGMSQPKVDWSAVGTSNSTSTTSYQIYEWQWDPSLPGWIENQSYVGSETGLTYTGGPGWAITAVTGDSAPDMCNYYAYAVQVKAYNQGAIQWSNMVWFQGPQYGTGPAC